MRLCFTEKLLLSYLFHLFCYRAVHKKPNQKLKLFKSRKRFQVYILVRKLNSRMEKKINSVSYESASESNIPENDAAEAEENAPENGTVETEEDTPGNNVVETEEEKNEGGNEKNNVIELIPMAQLPELNMEPQTPYTIDDIISVGTLMLTPVYHDSFRYQIR